MSLFVELKRRNVFRLGAVCVVVGKALVSVLLPGLGPDVTAS